MRRATSTSDSLELLLDTICNMFGGILFLSLLVVILLQLAGDAPDKNSEPESTSPVELSQLQHEMQTLHDELQRLRELRKTQDRQLATLSPQELQQLVNEWEAVQSRRDGLQSQREEAIASLAETTGDLTKLQSEIDQLDDQLAEARERIGELQLELERGRAARSQELRTPAVGDHGFLREVAVVAHYGRMYLVHAYDASGRRTGPNLTDLIVVGAGDDEVRITPNPVAGLPLNETTECRATILQRLQRFPASSYYIAIVVRPDSYGECRWLREALQSAGYKYRLMPTAQGDPITDRGGDGGNVQ